MFVPPDGIDRDQEELINRVPTGGLPTYEDIIKRFAYEFSHLGQGEENDWKVAELRYKEGLFYGITDPVEYQASLKEANKNSGKTPG